MALRKFSAILFLCVAAGLSIGTVSAEAPSPVESYLHQTVLLRGLVAGTELQFNERGKLTGGDARRVSFTLACLYVEKISLKGNTLTLAGRRVGLYNPNDSGLAFKSTPLILAALFTNGTFHVRRPLEERIDITVPGAEEESDFAPALQRVFARSWHEVSYALPSIWARITHQQKQDPFTGVPDALTATGSEPELLSRTQPASSEEANAVDAGGTCFVRALISPQGVPTHVEILKPLGLGMDERAADAVARYRFAPSVKDGKPIAVAMTLAVKFQPE